MKRDYGELALLIYTGAMILFLIAPLIVVIGISFNEGMTFKFPPEGFSLRWYYHIFSRPHVIRALRVSIILASFTAIVSTGIGLVTTYTIQRFRFRGNNLLSFMVLSPMLLPGLITGMSMLFLSARIGMMQSPYILALAHLIITLPFSVRIVSSGLPNLDIAYEEAAIILGASRFRTFYKVIIPMLKPAIVSSMLFVFVASFTNTGVSIFLIKPSTEPIAVVLFRLLDTGQNPGIAALSVVFIAIAMIAVITIGRLVKLEIIM